LSIFLPPDVFIVIILFVGFDDELFNFNTPVVLLISSNVAEFVVIKLVKYPVFPVRVPFKYILEPVNVGAETELLKTPVIPETPAAETDVLKIPLEPVNVGAETDVLKVPVAPVKPEDIIVFDVNVVVFIEISKRETVNLILDVSVNTFLDKSVMLNLILDVSVKTFLDKSEIVNLMLELSV